MNNTNRPRIAPAGSTEADQSIFTLNRGRRNTYAVALRPDTAPVMLALLQFDLGTAQDIVHYALTAIWYALKKAPIPKAEPKKRKRRGGPIVTVEEVLASQNNDTIPKTPA